MACSSTSSCSAIAPLATTNSFVPKKRQTVLGTSLAACSNTSMTPGTPGTSLSSRPAVLPVQITSTGIAFTPTTRVQNDTFYPAPPPLTDDFTSDSALFSDDWSEGWNETSQVEWQNANGSSEMTQQGGAEAPLAEPRSTQDASVFSGIKGLTQGDKQLLDGLLDTIHGEKKNGDSEVLTYTVHDLTSRVKSHPQTVVQALSPLLDAIITRGSSEHLTALLAGLGKQPYREALQHYMKELAGAGNASALAFLIANDKVRQTLGRAGNSAATANKSTFYSTLLATAAEYRQTSTLATLLNSDYVTRHLTSHCYNRLMPKLQEKSSTEHNLVKAMLDSAVGKKHLGKETLASVASYLIKMQPSDAETRDAFMSCRLAHTLHTAGIDDLLTLYTNTQTHDRGWTTWLIQQALRCTISPQTIGKMMVRFSREGDAMALTLLCKSGTLKKMDDSDKQTIIANMVSHQQEERLLAFHNQAQPSMNAYAKSINEIVGKKMARLMDTLAGHYRRQPFRALVGSKRDELTKALKTTADNLVNSTDQQPDQTMMSLIKTILPRTDWPIQRKP